MRKEEEEEEKRGRGGMDARGEEGGKNNKAEDGAG